MYVYGSKPSTISSKAEILLLLPCTFSAHFFVANIVVVALSLVISTVIVNCWSRGSSRRTGPPAILKMVSVQYLRACFDLDL